MRKDCRSSRAKTPPHALLQLFLRFAELNDVIAQLFEQLEMRFEQLTTAHSSHQHRYVY
jgi:hypothetical protein